MNSSNPPTSNIVLKEKRYTKLSSALPPRPPTASNAQRRGVDIRKLWWQQSVVRRTVAYIEHEFDHVLRQTPFLQGALPRAESVGLFHRSEVKTGNRIGRGGFSDVLEIVAFELDEEISERLSDEKQALREHYAKNAMDGDGKARFVIKQLQQRLLKNPKDFHRAAADMAIEAAFMSVLDHPNILSLKGLPVDGIEALSDGNHDGYFLIMERLEDTLDQRIKKWREGNDASLEEKVLKASELADAIEYLHANELIFRDLKPANVGFSSDGSMVLFDLGLVRQIPSSDTCDEVFEMSGVGTRRYMSPECVVEGRYNCKADVYSFSLVLWEMLSLARPYEKCSVQEHGEKVCKGGHRPMIPFAWPLSVQHLLEKSWTQSVKDRLSMYEVNDSLRSIAYAQQLMDFPESPKKIASATRGLAPPKGSSHSLPLLLSMSEDSDLSSSLYDPSGTFAQFTLSEDKSALVGMHIFPASREQD